MPELTPVRAMLESGVEKITLCSSSRSTCLPEGRVKPRLGRSGWCKRCKQSMQTAPNKNFPGPRDIYIIKCCIAMQCNAMAMRCLAGQHNKDISQMVPKVPSTSCMQTQQQQQQHIAQAAMLLHMPSAIKQLASSVVDPVNP